MNTNKDPREYAVLNCGRECRSSTFETFEAHADDLFAYMRQADIVHPTYRLAVIGSPSDNAIVFKVTIARRGCLVVKVMPLYETDEDNQSELDCAVFLGQFKGFAEAYGTHIVDMSHSFVVNLPSSFWYGDRRDEDSIEKAQLHDDLIDEALDAQDGRMRVDILVSRLYRCDLIVFFEDAHFRRRRDVSTVREMLRRLLDSIRTMRSYGFIHHDLHAGNVLLDTDHMPVVHDFGKTRRYATPRHVDQLLLQDSIDWRRVLRAIQFEVDISDATSACKRYMRRVVKDTKSRVGHSVRTTRLERPIRFPSSRGVEPLRLPPETASSRRRLFFDFERILDDD